MEQEEETSEVLEDNIAYNNKTEEILGPDRQENNETT